MKDIDNCYKIRFNCWSSAFSNDGVWLSLVEYLVWDQGVARSNRVTPTKLALREIRVKRSGDFANAKYFMCGFVFLIFFCKYS